MAVSNPLAPERLVVCAALRADGVVITSVRHYCPLMVDMIKRLGMEDAFLTAEQGFVDNKGKFLSREEALAVSTAAGQVNRDRPKSRPLHQLFSEDLC